MIDSPVFDCRRARKRDREGPAGMSSIIRNAPMQRPQRKVFTSAMDYIRYSILFYACPSIRPTVISDDYLPFVWIHLSSPPLMNVPNLCAPLLPSLTFARGKAPAPSLRARRLGPFDNVLRTHCHSFVQPVRERGKLLSRRSALYIFRLKGKQIPFSCSPPSSSPLGGRFIFYPPPDR